MAQSTLFTVRIAGREVLIYLLGVVVGIPQLGGRRFVQDPGGDGSQTHRRERGQGFLTVRDGPTCPAGTFRTFRRRPRPPAALPSKRPD